MRVYFQLLSVVRGGRLLGSINSIAFSTCPTCAQKPSGKVIAASCWTLGFHGQKGERPGDISRTPIASVTDVTFIDLYVLSIVLCTLRDFFKI